MKKLIVFLSLSVASLIAQAGSAQTGPGWCAVSTQCPDGFVIQCQAVGGYYPTCNGNDITTSFVWLAELRAKTFKD